MMFPEQIMIMDHKKENVYELRKDYPYIIRKITPKTGRKTVAPWHWHQEFEIIFVRKGAIEYSTPNRKAVIEEGDGLFVNSSLLHQVMLHQPSLEVNYDVHMFQKNFLAEENSQIEKRYIMPFLQSGISSMLPLSKSNTVHQKILNGLINLSQLEEEKAFGYEVHMRNMMSDVWLNLLSTLEVSENAAQSPVFIKENRLKEMLLYIQDHYMDNISLNDISNAANISKRECLRCFQKDINTTPFAYLVEYRIQAACGQLLNTKDTIMTIAMKSGFRSGSYFGKVFRKQMNCTPYEYRISEGQPFSTGNLEGAEE